MSRVDDLDGAEQIREWEEGYEPDDDDLVDFDDDDDDEFEAPDDVDDLLAEIFEGEDGN